MTDQAPFPIRWLARVAMPLAIAFAAPAAASPASDRAAILHRVAAMVAAWRCVADHLHRPLTRAEVAALLG